MQNLSEACSVAAEVITELIEGKSAEEILSNIDLSDTHLATLAKTLENLMDKQVAAGEPPLHRIVTHRIPTTEGDIVIDTDGNGGAILKSPFEDDDSCFSAAIDGMESLLLALASQGVDIGAEAFSKAVQTTLDAIGETHGD